MPKRFMQQRVSETQKHRKKKKAWLEPPSLKAPENTEKRRRKRSKMQLVLIEWIDAVYHDLWEPLDDTDPTDMTVQSVGWLAKDTSEYKLVVPHQQCSQVRGGFTIPSRAIVKIEKLTVDKG